MFFKHGDFAVFEYVMYENKTKRSIAMKRFISLVLAIFTVITMCGMTCSAAVSIKAGDDALMAQFKDGKTGQHDYVYYSPVKSSKDSAKYPLFIWIHGKNSGFVKGMQLTTTQIYNWSSSEYQSRFANSKGCFIFLPRSKGNTSIWTEADTSSLKKTIDGFISANKKNIDTSRIYIAGNSAGGMMVYKMLAAYPNFFGGALLPSAVYEPSKSELKSMRNLAVWFFANKNDEYSLSRADAVKKHFDYLVSISSDPTLIRMTTCTQSINPDGSKITQLNNQHYIWGTVTNDMFMNDGSVYKYTSTVDGSGKKITFKYPNGVIYWLSRQTNVRLSNGTGTISPMARITNFMKIIADWFKAIIRGVVS